MDNLLNTIKKLLPTKLFKILQPPYHFLLSWFSAFIYGHPSEKLIVVGVTGTTGKTTSVYLIAKALEEAGIKVGYTSTAMFNDGQKEWLNDKKMTMMGRFFTQKILKTMFENNCKIAIIETTSEGVRQFRHRFINYDILVVTGLYPEHIESHGSFENYKCAKGQLFSHLKRCRTKYRTDDYMVEKTYSNLKKLNYKRIKKTIIANLDDDYADYFLNFWSEEKYAFVLMSHERPALRQFDIKDLNIVEYDNITASPKGISFRAEETPINMQILGSFNAANAMCAYTVAKALELDSEKIKIGLENIEGVAGRLENINEGQDYTVVVDYAFEPNAVSKLYETMEKIEHARIIHVLGSAGGGRDIARRPILGKIAGKQADIVIVTNEDPYDEDPIVIMEQVALGAEKEGKKNNEDLFKILDRREAIKKALNLAQKDDIVLITGKGSEQAIVVKNGEKIPWDDRAVVRSLLVSEHSN